MLGLVYSWKTGSEIFRLKDAANQSQKHSTSLPKLEKNKSCAFSLFSGHKKCILEVLKEKKEEKGQAFFDSCILELQITKTPEAKFLL